MDFIPNWSDIPNQTKIFALLVYAILSVGLYMCFTRIPAWPRATVVFALLLVLALMGVVFLIGIHIIDFESMDLLG